MAQAGSALKEGTGKARGRQKKADEQPQTREITVGGRTIQMTQETVPTGLVPLPKFLRRFAGIE